MSMQLMVVQILPHLGCMLQSRINIIYKQTFNWLTINSSTLPQTNSSNLKADGWKMVLSFLGPRWARCKLVVSLREATSISSTILPLALNQCLVLKSRPAVRRSPSQSCGTRPGVRPGERTLPGDMATWPPWKVREWGGLLWFLWFLCWISWFLCRLLIGNWYDLMYLYQPTWLESKWIKYQTSLCTEKA